jgi:tripartite-type tricarboxylate transporter receptor subunit TctC
MIRLAMGGKMRLLPGRLIALLSPLLPLTAAVLPAAAQEYPVKPVRIVIGFAPGNVPDVAARTLAARLSPMLGQPFVIENRAGGATTIATGLVAKSPADGYTLLMNDNAQHVMAPFLFKDLPYHPLKDFTPVGLIAGGSLVLVSSDKSPIRTLDDLIRLAKASPSAINYGTAAVGGIHHIATEAFASGSGIRLTHVPYKGGASQTVPAVLSGEVWVTIIGLQSVMQHIKSGRLHPLAVTAAARRTDLPDVPSLSEVVKGYDYGSEVGMLGPAGLPAEVLGRLSRATMQALDSPELLEQFRKIGMGVTPRLTPAEYADYLARSSKKYEAAIKLANIQPE